MKRTIAILLVAIMAVGSAFAAFSGSAQVGVGANFDNGNYGFIDNSNSVGVNFELANMAGEAVGEGDIRASIKGSLVLEVFTADDYKKSADGKVPADPTTANAIIVGDWGDNMFIGLGASVDEAKIEGSNWYISLLGVPGGPDFAKSAIDTYDKAVKKYDIVTDEDGATGNASWSVPYVKAPGVEFGVADYVVGAGFWADAQSNPDVDLFNQYAATAYFMTPSFDLNGLTLQAGAVYSLSSGDSDKSFSDKNDNKAYNSIGASAKVGFTNDAFAVSAATDIGYDIENEEFGADVAANFTYDFLTVDGYYGTNSKVKDDGSKVKNLLSAQVITDLNAMDMPIKVTASAKDLINAQDFDLSVEFKVGAFTLTPSVGYVINTEKFNAGLKGQYDHEYFTAKASVSVETGFDKPSTTLKASASVENTTIIPGSTIKIEWKDAEDLLNNSADHEKNFGKLIASIKVEF